MAFTEITPEEININPFTSWSRYVLVTAGNIKKCNTLLVTWGGFGVMWRKKTATIYIRQSRFTKTILDSQDYFTHHAGYTQILIAISDTFTVFVKLRQQLVGVCADFLIYRISCIAAG